RARNLHKAARLVVSDYQGQLPRTAKELRALPGVGRYTAGAVASIAHRERAAVVDGNVGRVYSRMFELSDVPTSSVGQRTLWGIAERIVPEDEPGDFNQALMELGATVCTPKSPKCLLCPVREQCDAYAKGSVERFPVPKPRAKRKPMSVVFAWVESDTGGLWLVQRALSGLWAGLWEMPSATTVEQLCEDLGAASAGEPLAQVEHTLSHRDVVATVFAMPPLDRSPPRWRHYDRPLDAPLSALARKAIEAVGPPEARF
ncbi:MAG: NUDIX domain-containing protein, partial [Myxococcota bacterium]